MHVDDLLDYLNRPCKTPLQTVFWRHGVLASHAAFGVILIAYLRASTAVLGVLLAAFMIYTGWILNAIWVCAGNVENPLFGHVARYLTVAWALNAILVSVFLFLSHFNAGTSSIPILP